MRLTALAASLFLAAPALADGHVAEDLAAVVTVSMSGTILDRDGNNIGSISVLGTESGVTLINVAAIDMEPGAYGIHLHETGVCEGDFSSAGGHIAGDANHGFVAGGPHPGDLPNGFVSEGATALNYQAYNERISFDDHLLDADGAALIIHGGPDDHVSQPGGDAGDRIACAVLEND